MMTIRLSYYVLMAASLLVPASLHAAEHTLTLIVGKQPERISVDASKVTVVGRAGSASFVCVEFSQQDHPRRGWAMPEFWMTDVKAVDVSSSTAKGQVAGPGNGIGNLRELKVMKQNECV